MAGTLQSLCWASAAFGGIASSYFSGSLVQAWGPRGVFALTAAFPLVVSAAAVLIDEQPAAGPRFKPDRTYLSARTRGVPCAGSPPSCPEHARRRSGLHRYAERNNQRHASVARFSVMHPTPRGDSRLAELVRPAR